MPSFFEVATFSEEIASCVTDGQRTDGRTADPKTQASRRLVVLAAEAKKLQVLRRLRAWLPQTSPVSLGDPAYTYSFVLSDHSDGVRDYKLFNRQCARSLSLIDLAIPRAV